MMDCNNALAEADGNMEKATLILREKGLANQVKKAGRIAAEGLVVATVKGNVGAVVEVNSETDFVAKNPEFINFANKVAETVIEKNPADLDALMASPISGGSETVKEALDTLFLKIRENLQVRRFERVEGIAVPYVHGGGQIGVLVVLESSLPADKLQECGKNCALQVAAMSPRFLNKESVPQNVIDEENGIIKVQMADDPKLTGKPENILQNIAKGKLTKALSEICLLEQLYVKDDNFTVGKYVESVGKSLGGDIKVVKYIRFERGEGIEKKADNFAEEVANMVKG
jgi:elongation factor Ts